MKQQFATRRINLKSSPTERYRVILSISTDPYIRAMCREQPIWNMSHEHSPLKHCTHVLELILYC